MDRLTVKVADVFGEYCGNGEEATIYRHAHVDPYVNEVDEIVIDFTGVEMVNSSFVNALVANLIKQGFDIYGKLELIVDDESVHTMVEIARDLGVSKLKQRQTA